MLKPEAALDSWREWDASLDTRPVVIGPLGGGRSNRSFLLESGGQKMVLRINATDELLPGHGRASETRAWQAASAAGIAPTLLYSEPDGMFLVSSYIENTLPQQPVNDVNLAHKAFAVLQACHRLEINVPAIDYVAHIDAYWQIIKDRGLSTEPALQAERDPMRRILDELLNSDPVTVLCHHDPVVENFVGSSEKMYLLDWEYAAYGLSVMDYAAFAMEWGLANAAIARLSGLDKELLLMARKFYRYQCRLWEAITLSLHSG